MKKIVVALLCTGLVFCNSSAAFAEDFYQGDYEDSASKKIAVHTLNDVNVSADNGTVSVNVRSLEVQEVTIKDNATANMIGMVQNEPCAAVSAYLEFKNMSDHDVSVPVFSMQIVTDTEEQSRCAPMLCDQFSGMYYGTVKEDGCLTFLLPDSDPYEIGNITFIIDAMFDQTSMQSLDIIKIPVEIPEDDAEESIEGE